jgi:hypothetical protein
MKKYITFYYLIMVFIIGNIAGCTAAYLPWNAGTRWNFSSTDDSSSHTIETNFESMHVENLEEFCEDNRVSVSLYRTYLEPTYTWSRRLTDGQIESRKENIQSFLTQYDSYCH